MLSTGPALPMLVLSAALRFSVWGARVDHGLHLAAAALEEDVRRGVRVQRGLQLAVVVLVLDVLHLDRDARVSRVELLDGVLEVGEAGAGVAFVQKVSVTGPLADELSFRRRCCHRWSRRRRPGRRRRRARLLPQYGLSSSSLKLLDRKLGTTATPQTRRGSGGKCLAATHGRLLGVRRKRLSKVFEHFRRAAIVISTLTGVNPHFHSVTNVFNSY